MYTGLVGELQTFSASALVGHEWPAHDPSALPMKKLLLISIGYKVSGSHSMSRCDERWKIPAHAMNETQVNHSIKCLRSGEVLSAANEWSYVDLLHTFTDSKVQSSSMDFCALYTSFKHTVISKIPN